MEFMRLLDWEWLGKPEDFKIVQRGPLPNGLTNGSIARTEDMRLSLKATGALTEEHVKSALSGRLLGELSSELVGISLSGKSIQVSGMVDAKPNLSVVESRIEVSGHCKKVTKKFSETDPSFHTIWLLNFKFPYDPPLSTRRISRHVFSMVRANGHPVEKTVELSGGSCDHSSVVTDRGVVRFGKVSFRGAPSDHLPGFLEFGWVPSGEEIDLWLNAISFAMGRRLYSIGWTRFDGGYDPVAACAIDPWLSYRRRYWQGSHHWLPTHDYVVERRFERDRLESFLKSLYGVVKELKLDYSLGLYWYGIEAPIDAAPVILGAALESLRDAYLGRDSLKYLADPAWRRLRSKLLLELRGFEDSLSEEDVLVSGAIDAFGGALNRINDVSSSGRTAQFFSRLGINLGAVERAALNSRHKAAHGGRPQDDELERLVRNVSALRTLYNRCLLRISGCVESYIDFSGDEAVDRSLDEPMRGPAVDWKRA